jgi:hypothetical protein
MRICEVTACAACPWIWWRDDKPFCHNPESLDRKIKDTLVVQSFCMLDELSEIEIEE